MCGTVVSASVSECPGCGEQFSPVDEVTDEPLDQIEAEPEYDEETVVEETEETFVQDDITDEEPEGAACENCETLLDEDGKCASCQPLEKVDKPSSGCPMCSGTEYTVESGDLVSCTGCGNVYVLKEFEPSGQNWKWKFWVGLVFILVGNIGMALFSYVHNVVRWSPLGDMYLGYGWMDRMLGFVGIIIFLLGLILFAWSFKREREVQCPSCKMVIRQSQFEIYEPPEEEDVPKEDAVKSALEEIGEFMECPSCGTSVSMFDASCGNCGTLFETEFEFEEPNGEPVAPEDEPAQPDRLLSASEIDEDEMIMESLELETPEPELNGNGLADLAELESAFQISMEDGTVCPSCGARVGKGLDTCPGCGERLNGGE